MTTQLPTRPGHFLLGSAADHAENFFLTHDDEVFAIQLDFGAGVFPEENAVTLFYGQGEHFAFVVALATPDGDDFALLRFVFGSVWDNDSTAGGAFFFHATDQDSVM